MLTNEHIQHISMLPEKEWQSFYKKHKNKIWKRDNFDFDQRTENLKEVSKVLEKTGFKALLANGALLGAYRNNDFIPWDHDIDFDCLAPDFYDKCDEAKEEFMKLGYIARLNKAHWFAKLNIYKGLEKISFAALFPLPSPSENYYARARQKWRQSLYQKTEIINFKGMDFICPSPIEEYLEYCYGKDWRIPKQAANSTDDTIFSKEMQIHLEDLPLETQAMARQIGVTGPFCINPNGGFSGVPTAPQHHSTENQTSLLMNHEQWSEASDKFFHNFDENLPFEQRKDMLFEVDNILKLLGLKYWLTMGTALGLVRNNQFISWDDDIDIDIYSEALIPRFDALVHKLAEAGYVCRYVHRGNTSKVSAYKNNFKISISMLYLDGEWRRSKFTKLPKRFFENSIEYTIDDRQFNIPAPTDEYLSLIYKDWKVPLRSDDERDTHNGDFAC